MNRFHFMFFALSSSLFLPAAYSQPKTMLTLVTETLPPYQMLEDNKVTGFATEIVTEMMKQTDFDYQIKLYPWSRSYNYAQKKSNTCIFSIARSAKREHLFQWVQPIAIAVPAFIGLKSNKHLDVNSLEDAKKYITAVIRDDISHQVLVKSGFKEFEHFYVVNNTDSLLKLLMTRDNIDLVLTDPLTIPFRALHNNIDETLFIKIYQVDKEKQTFYLACSNKTSPEVIATLNHAIITIKENGAYQKIMNRWALGHIGVLHQVD